MLDVSVAYNRYKFLGYEFLTWLWFCIEKEPEALKRLDADLLSLDVGNRVVLENRKSEAVETISISGDDAGLEEGLLALQKGAVVTEMNLAYRSGEQQWKFTIKGESLNMANLKSPETGPVESKEDMDGAVLEKAYLNDQVVKLVDALFNDFIRKRVSNEWLDKVLPRIKKWITA